MEEFPIVVDVELSLFAQVAGHIPMVMNEAAAHEDHCVMAVFQDAVAMCQMGENPFLVVTGWDTFDVPKGMKGHKVRQFLDMCARTWSIKRFLNCLHEPKRWTAFWN